MIRKIKKLILILALAASACSQALPQADATAPARPQADKVTVYGRIVSTQGAAPLGDLIVRLGEVVREEDGTGGVFIMDEGKSPGYRTDSQGNFLFENVPPMEYVVLVGYREGQYKFIPTDEGLPRIWKAEPGQILDLGVLESDVQR